MSVVLRSSSSLRRALCVALAVLLAFVAWGSAAGDSAGRTSGTLINKLGGKRTATVWAVGDGGDGGPPAVRIAKMVERDKADLFLYLGDVYEYGTAEDYRKLYKPVYRHIDRITAPTPGNHEWPRHAEGYDPYWRKVMKKPIASWYRISVAGWEVFSLNSEDDHLENQPQIQWLRSKLSGKRGTCRLAFWHRPLYAGGHGGNPDVATFWNELRGHATLVLNGHDHNSQRYKPIDGITQIIAGGGGDGLHPIVTPDPNRTFQNQTAYAALRLELRSGRASFRFVSSGGKTLNKGRVECKPNK